MKIVLIIIGSLVGVTVLCGLIAALVGSRMPVHHVASRSLRLNRKTSDVYAVVRNFGEAGSWRTDVKQVEMLGTDKFRETGSHGKVTYQIVSDVPNQKIVTRIMDVDLGYSGEWEYKFEGSGEATTITITENGEVTNPLFRFMSKYFFGHTATIDAYLKALNSRFS